MKTGTLVNCNRLIITSLTTLFCTSAFISNAQNQVASVTVSSQSGVPVYGASGNTTFTVTLVPDASPGNGTSTLSLDWLSTPPSGTTFSFSTSAISLPDGSATAQTVTLIITSANNTNADNYDFTVSASTNTTPQTSGTASFVVNQAPLTIQAGNQNKVYGNNLVLGTTAFITTGLVNDETIGDITLSSSGATNAADVNIYPIVASAATGGTFNAANYTITYADGSLNVTQAILTITANDGSKPYGTVYGTGTGSTAFTSTGLQNDETIGSITISSTGAPANASVAGSPYSIVPSAATGGSFNAANYTITYSNGSLTVTKAALTIAANDRNKVYGSSLTLGTTAFTSSGLQNGETIDGVTLTSTGAGNTANVGTYPVIPSAATGGTFNANNYSISYTNGILTVTTTILTITADNQSKVYGVTGALGNTAFTTTGLQNSQTIGSVTLTSTGTVNTATTGTYPIVPSNATGGTFTPANYTISYTNGTLTVTKANTTIAITTSGTPSCSGGSIAFTATITSVLSNATGTVQFYDGATLLGTASVTSGTTATFSTSTLTTGSHTTIKATYLGDGNYNGSSSSNLTQVVNTPASISGQPSNQTTCSGTAKTFSVTAGGTSPVYQWQYSANGSTGWANVVNGTPANITYGGATGTTLTATPAAAAVNGVYYYRCAVNVTGCAATPATSNVASLTVYTQPNSNAGPDQNVTCGAFITTLAAVASAGTGAWTIVSGTGGIITNPSSPTSTFTGIAANAYTLRWTETNGTCTDNDDVIIRFNYNLNGVYSVGAGSVAGEAGHFTTLTRAAENYNTCLGGNTTFVLTDATYSTSETFPVVFGNTAASSTKTLTIKPNGGVNSTITGNNSTAIIQLNGADYITIDGSNNGTTTQNLTIKNTSTNAPLVIPTSTVVWVTSRSAANGATNNVIKNCKISGSGKTTTLGCIISGDNTSPSFNQADFPNSNNTIQNCAFTNAGYGVYIYGATAKDNNWNIINNSFGSGYGAGIYAQYVQSLVITGNTISGIDVDGGLNFNTAGIEIGGNVTTLTITSNTISNITNTGATIAGNTDGIRIGTATQAFSITGNTISNISSSGGITPSMGIEINGVMSGTNYISYNKISNISQTYTALGAYFGAEGIYLNTSGTPTIWIYNNFILNVTSRGNNTVPILNTNVSGYNENGYGIMVDAAAAGSNHKIYYNTINLISPQERGLSAAINIAGDDGGVANGTIDLRDNILVNSQTSGAAQASRYSIYSGASNAVFSSINYNDYFTATGSNLGYIGSNRTNLMAIQTGFGGNTNSLNIKPNFISATDLHLDPANNASLDGLGVPITGITDDIDADIRSTATPDLGADEFDICSATLYTWTGDVNDDWNVAGNWCSNAVPTTAVDALIPAGRPNNPKIYNAVANAKSINLNASATLTMANSQTLNIVSGFTNNGTFAAGDGTINFTAAATFSGNAATFNNVGMTGNLTLSAIPTINGNFTINSGQILTNSPVYGSNSTLIYNITVAYTTGIEWNAGAAGTIAPGSGIPQNVIIQSGVITIPDALGANRALAGNLVINSGKTLQMTAGGRDLYILGNWTNNGGTFNANGRTVDFNLTSATPKTQTISGTTTFYNLSFGNSNITTDFGTSVTTVANQFNNNAGTMAGGTSTVTLTGSAGTIIGGSAKNFYNLQINNTSVITHSTGGGLIHVANSFVNNGALNEGNTYTFFFDSPGGPESFTGSGLTNFGKLTIGDGSGFSSAIGLTCGADFTINGGAMTFFHNSIYNGNTNTATFSTAAATVAGTGIANFYNAETNVALNLGSGISTINNNLQINAGGSVVTNAPFYASAATLIYNTITAALPTSIEWTNNTVATGSGAPFSVTIQNANNVVIAGDRTVPGKLSIAAANTLVLNGRTLTVNTAVSGTGSLTGSLLSNLILGGSAPSLYFTPGSYDNYLKTLEVKSASSVTLGNALNIAAGSYNTSTSTANYGVVTATGTLASNGNLTLKSDVNGTALVGPSTGSITGNVTVERFVPPYRAWRFLAVPFASSSQTINQAWQEGAVNPCLGAGCNVDPNPGYGMQVTYDGSTGFDPNVTSNPSLLLWDVPTQKWTTYAPPTMGTNIRAHTAYDVFVRGSRNNDLAAGTAALPGATTLRITGILNETGAAVSTGTLSGGDGQYVLTGNPFAAPLNVISALNNAGSAGVNLETFGVMDPKFNSDGRNVGTFVLYNTVTKWVPSGAPSYPATYPPVVQSGQGFMVKLSGTGTHQVQYRQADKYSGEQADVFGLQKKEKPTPVIYTNLMAKAQTKDSLVIADGIAAGFGTAYSNVVDGEDVPKLLNLGENILLVRDGKWLSIEMRDLPKADDTLFYRLSLRAMPYTLKIFSKDLNGIAQRAWVVDKYLNTQTEINLKDTSLYSFTPNSDTNSYRNRFMLVFKPSRDVRDVVDSILARIKARIYPNPVSGKEFRLELDQAVKGNYTVNVFTMKGRLVATRTVYYEGNRNVYNIKVPATITAGSYLVQVLNDKGIAVASIPLVISR